MPRMLWPVLSVMLMPLHLLSEWRSAVLNRQKECPRGESTDKYLLTGMDGMVCTVNAGRDR